MLLDCDAVGGQSLVSGLIYYIKYKFIRASKTSFREMIYCYTWELGRIALRLVFEIA